MTSNFPISNLLVFLQSRQKVEIISAPWQQLQTMRGRIDKLCLFGCEMSLNRSLARLQPSFTMLHTISLSLRDIQLGKRVRKCMCTAKALQGHSTRTRVTELGNQCLSQVVWGPLHTSYTAQKKQWPLLSVQPVMEQVVFSAARPRNAH